MNTTTKKVQIPSAYDNMTEATSYKINNNADLMSQSFNVKIDKKELVQNWIHARSDKFEEKQR